MTEHAEISPERQPVWVDRAAALTRLLEALDRSPRLALDLEGDGYHRYPERIALVQIALPDGSIYLVDPLAVGDLGGLDRFLSDASKTKVMHSADFDLRSLDRDYGVSLRGLVDTAIAARFCGSARTGLAAVIAEYLGLRLDKRPEIQRFDWSMRPLPDHAFRYAANDVAHLLALHDRLADRLAELGRWQWLIEECRRLEQVRYAPPDPPEESFRHIRGAAKLNGRQLAALREMCVYRERAARQLGRPPSRLLPDRLLLSLAQGHTSSVARRRQLADLWDGLLAARQRGYQMPVAPSPTGRGMRPWPAEAIGRLEALKRWRRREAARLGLAVDLVWPLAHLERGALFPDGEPSELDDRRAPLVRGWQWQVLGRSLESARRELLASSSAGQPRSAPSVRPAAPGSVGEGHGHRG